MKDAKRLLGLEVHQDVVEKADSARVMEYSGFNKIEVTINFDGLFRRKDWRLLSTTT